MTLPDFKTIGGAGRIVSAPGTLRVLSDRDGRMQDVELWFLNEKKTRSRAAFRDMRRHLPLFAGIPILAAFVGGRLGRQSGHNFREVPDGAGGSYASFLDEGAEHIYGYIPSEQDLRIDVRDGAEWLVARAKIWTWYAQELVRKLRAQGLDGQQVSVEVLVDRMSRDADGDEVYEDYTPLGVTVLGDGVTEAVAGAYIRTLSANGAEELRKNTKLYVASVCSGAEKPIHQNKGETHRMKLKLKDLESHFGGFRVLAVNGDTVALLSETGVPYLSTASKSGDEIVTGAKTEANAVLTFSEGEHSAEVPLEAVTDTLLRRCEALQSDLESEKAARQAAETALGNMQKQERLRRLESVKKTVLARFEEISRSNPAVSFTGEEYKPLLSDERLEAYAAMEDASGRFLGAEKARGDLDALCMDLLLAAGRVSSRMAWDLPAASEERQDKIESAIENILK